MTNLQAWGIRLLRTCWPKLMGATALFVGFGYAFGPEDWYQAPSLELVRRFIVPVPVWGVLMMVSGLLILTKKWADVGHFIAVILWSFWFCCISVVAALSLISTVADRLGYGHIAGLPQLNGWGVAAYVLVYLSVHAYMLFLPNRKARG